MHRIEYEIGLNDNGRPCIDLPEDYEHKAEDRFFAIEVARYVLQDVYNRRSAEFDKEAAETIDITIRLLGQVGDNIAEILWNQMKAQGELAMMLNSNYHIRVNSIEERDALPEKDIIYNDKIFDRVEGLKVYCRTFNNETLNYENETFELVDGITNENWKLIG
jgi:hypothetical protein